MYVRILGILVFSFAFGLVGCLEGTTQAKAGTEEKKLTPDQAEAERLALSAEPLINPVAFMYANEILQKAIKLDPNNQRAGIYLAVLTPVMKIKGLTARVAPYVAKLPQNMRMEYQHRLSEIKAGPLKDFLANGSGDLRTEADIQNLAADITADFESARQYFKRIKTGPQFAAHLTEYTALNSDECTVISDDNGGYQMQDCGLGKLRTISFGQPDFEFVQQYLTGFEVYGIATTAYDASGYSLLMNALGGAPGDEVDVVRYLRGLPAFGLLKAQNRLRDILAMGSDLAAGVRYMQAMQANLCPGGNAIARPGYALNYGFCLSSTTDDGQPLDQLLNLATLALSGTTVDYNIEDKSGAKVGTKIQLYNPLAHPIADMRVIMPNMFDACGQGTNLGDPTLAGFFPNGDAERFVLKSKVCNQ